MRDLLTVVGLRTCWELRGRSCLPLAHAPGNRKSLAVTRSFGRSVESWSEMEQAIATYAARAAEKLRRYKLVASAMQVFLQTNRFSKIDRQYVNQSTFGIEPTADSFALIGSASRAAARLWRDGYRFAKAGVILLDLRPMQVEEHNFFPSRDRERSSSIMQAMDGINRRYGRNTVRPGLVAPKPRWGMRRAMLSPCYTTRLDDILKVRA